VGTRFPVLVSPPFAVSVLVLAPDQGRRRSTFVVPVAFHSQFRWLALSHDTFLLKHTNR